jgi:alkaline phosphatase D
MKQAVQAGLPVERFLAGPRTLLRPLTELPDFQEFASSRASSLIHGPMLGCVTDHSARVWVRAVRAVPVVVHVSLCDQQGNVTDKVVCTASATADPQHDYTATIDLTGLEPETQYVYDVLIADQSVFQKERPRLTTFPSSGSAGQLKIAFGGGAGYSPINERMWDTIASSKPDALFLLGDNVYIDLAEEPRGLHRYTYYRRQSRPEFRRLVASTPVYAIWDDHDCGLDDVWMGPYLDRPAWKPAMLTVFKENWVNPAYGNHQEPGCWFETSLAGVDFFFLDTRYFRTNPHGKHPTMLGPVQKQWLLAKLKNSQSDFKVIVSSVPWAPESKPGSRDTWDGFREEREEIFGWIESQRIEGVLLLTADRHRSEARKIDRPKGYPLYDLMSSKITNMHTHECLPGTIFCYNGGCSFGLLTIDLTAPDPTAMYEVVDIDGETVHTLKLCRSQLSF